MIMMMTYDDDDDTNDNNGNNNDNNNRYVAKSRHLATYQGLLELESSLTDFVT